MDEADVEVAGIYKAYSTNGAIIGSTDMEAKLDGIEPQHQRVASAEIKQPTKGMLKSYIFLEYFKYWFWI